MAGYEQPGKTPEQNPDDKPQPEEASLTDWLQSIDAPNLVPVFIGEGEEPFEDGAKFLGTVAEQACKDIKQGRDESQEYRDKRKVVNRLYTGFLKKKTFPHADACNAHIPLMLERIQRLSANVYAEICQDREMIYGVKATGPDDYETAEVLTIHGNWRLRNELTDFLGQLDKAVTEFFLAGSVFCYSWRDTKLNRNRHDIMTVDEFIVPYVFRTDQVDMSDVPWKARVVRKYRHELEDMRDSGEWAQIDAVLAEAPPPHEFMEDTMREQGEQREGIRSGGDTRPYVFYDYHGWLRMPGETNQRPIRAIVSADRKIVVLLQVREEEDWRDQMRFERESQELAEYQAATAAFQQASAEFEARTAAGMPPIDMNTGQPLPPPEPPPPPQWAQPDETGAIAPSPIKRVPVEMFSHGRCSYNPDGMLGLGFGDVLAPFNKMSDESLNRFFDQATANNSPALLTAGEQLPGNTALVPGKVIQLKNVSGDDLNKVIKELRPGPANPQLMEVVRYGDEASDSAVAAPGILSGEPGKSGETFRGVSIRAEKATKQLTVAGIKLLAFLDQILKNDAKLNALFLPDSEIVQVNDHLADYRKFTMEPGPPGPIDPATGQPTPGPEVPKKQLVITRDMYRRRYDVTFTADVRFTSQAQKIAEADEMLAMVNQVFPPFPPNAPVPDPMAALRYAVTADVMRARGKSDLIPLLGPTPTAPAMPIGTPVMPPPPPPGMAGPAPGGPPPKAGDPPK